MRKRTGICILDPWAGGGRLLVNQLGDREILLSAGRISRALMIAVVGIFVGALGKAVCCIAMMALFAFSVIRSSLVLPP